MDHYQHRAYERLTVEQDVIRAAAGLLRNPDARRRMAGLADPRVAECMADLLDRIATDLDTGDPELRRVTVDAARTIIGAPMDRPTVRRTRRRR